MELSDEQKQRILEEEKRRLAEEQYREQVRRELLNQNTTSGSVPQRAKVGPQTKPKTARRVLAFVAIVVGLCALVLLFNRLQTSFLSSRQSGIAAPQEEKKLPVVEAPVKLTTAQVAEKATPSVVVVENINQNGEKAGQGSGYIYSDDGTIITNYHVIRGAGALNVRLHSGVSYRIDSIGAYDIAHDVAILQVSGASVPPLPTQDVELAKVGDKVVAIGAPLGLESTVSEGIISALREMGGTHIIQTTTSISPGSSGGPLLNEYGKVIGLTTAQMRDGQNLNFVISATHIRELLERKHPIALSEMLIETQTTTQIAANTFTVPARNGWKITLNVPMQQGAVLEGSYEVRGGGGNDVDVVITTSDNRLVLNSGRVSGSGQIKVPLPRGSYVLYFNNQFSTFTSKSVSPDLKLVYYR
jgi:hypothetical protein